MSPLSLGPAVAPRGLPARRALRPHRLSPLPAPGPWLWLPLGSAPLCPAGLCFAPLSARTPPPALVTPTACSPPATRFPVPSSDLCSPSVAVITFRHTLLRVRLPPAGPCPDAGSPGQGWAQLGKGLACNSSALPVTWRTACEHSFQ